MPRKKPFGGTFGRASAFLTLLVFAAAAPLVRAEGEKLTTFNGKVVSLDDRLKKPGVPLDAEASPPRLVLLTDDGKILPLGKDDGSRRFFKDARLRDKSLRLTGRFVEGSIQVTGVQRLVNGRLHDVYYWCAHCALRAEEPGPCRCCGGPTELVEVPVD